MGAMQRRKGATFERTMVNMLKEEGFHDAMRNHAQTAIGGYDIVGVDPFAIEVKNHKKLSINTWWVQTLAQTPKGFIPTLIYKIPNTSKIMVQMPLSAVNQELSSDRTVTMSFDDFIYVAREVIL